MEEKKKEKSTIYTCSVYITEKIQNFILLILVPSIKIKIK